mmetsp:Transcript_61946/g.134234  ORF Transcript_61946/g.134234 Transcript_61946/m.134234 type:complete len:200 (+) Transcript_61946:583-1182(+)
MVTLVPLRRRCDDKISHDVLSPGDIDDLAALVPYQGVAGRLDIGNIFPRLHAKAEKCLDVLDESISAACRVVVAGRYLATLLQKLGFASPTWEGADGSAIQRSILRPEAGDGFLPLLALEEASLLPLSDLGVLLLLLPSFVLHDRLLRVQAPVLGIQLQRCLEGEHISVLLVLEPLVRLARITSGEVFLLNTLPARGKA